jgi:hypothetical protein
MLAVVIGGHSPPGGVKSPEATGASLAKLLGDVVLVYAGETGGSYQPGTSLRQWSEHARRGEGGDVSVMSTTPESARRMGIAPVAEGKLPVLRGGVSFGPEQIGVQTLIGASQRGG